MPDAPLTLSSPDIRAEVADLGAELVRLEDRDGRDLLWNGDPAVWAGRAPLLFPMVGRARDDRIRVEGRDHPLPQHGFARTSRFEVAERSPGRCVLELRESPETLRAYPFRFRLRVTYAVAGATLACEAELTNTDDRVLPASFGFHPAFRWPLPYGEAREAHALTFERPETGPVHRPADGLLGPAEPSPVQERRLPLADALFQRGALVFLAPASRSVRYGAPGGPLIEVAFPGMPHLGVWTKPGAGFVCIEPWQGYAATPDFSGEFADRPGVVPVEPGGSRRFGMTVTWLAA